MTLVGNSKEKQKEQKSKQQAKQQTQKKSKSQVANSSRQSAQRQPTPATRSQAGRTNPYRSQAPNQRKSAQLSGSGSNGFGLTVTDRKSGTLVISKVDPRGNAAEAGVRPGDIIKEIGGVPVTTENEFAEFSKVLGQGDQMEFKIVSRGKDKSVHIQFGQIPEADQESILQTVPVADDSGRQNGLKSVINPTSNFRQASAQISSLQIENLQRTIQQQQQTIHQLQQELNRLRRGTTKSSRNGLFMNSPTR